MPVTQEAITAVAIGIVLALAVLLLLATYVIEHRDRRRRLAALRRDLAAWRIKTEEDRP